VEANRNRREFHLVECRITAQAYNQVTATNHHTSCALIVCCWQRRWSIIGPLSPGARSSNCVRSTLLFNEIQRLWIVARHGASGASLFTPLPFLTLVSETWAILRLDYSAVGNGTPGAHLAVPCVSTAAPLGSPSSTAAQLRAGAGC
jgi:hypothetical protein